MHSQGTPPYDVEILTQSGQRMSHYIGTGILVRNVSLLNQYE